jgi:hypothetical protein
VEAGWIKPVSASYAGVTTQRSSVVGDAAKGERIMTEASGGDRRDLLRSPNKSLSAAAVGGTRKISDG